MGPSYFGITTIMWEWMFFLEEQKVDTVTRARLQPPPTLNLGRAFWEIKDALWPLAIVETDVGPPILFNYFIIILYYII